MAHHRCYAALYRGNSGGDPESPCRAEFIGLSMDLVLASSSAGRRMMLEAAGVPFTVTVPSVDEDILKSLLLDAGKDEYALAGELAQEKALSVSRHMLGTLVLGADQVLICDGRI